MMIMSPDIFKCKICGGEVTFTGERQDVKYNGQNIGNGGVLECPKCKTGYVALMGKWFKYNSNGKLEEINPLERMIRKP